MFIWELVGVDLNKAIATGGNIGAIVNSIRSPQAVPWVLLILVGYFAFKLRVEWRQSSAARREIREAKHDYYSAWTVAMVAVILYVGQAISHIQLANVLSSDNGTAFTRGLLMGLSGSLGVFLLIKWWRRPPTVFAILMLIVPLVGLVSFLKPGSHRELGLIGLAVGAAFAGANLFVFKYLYGLVGINILEWDWVRRYLDLPKK